jgi:hypothetical protein
LVVSAYWCAELSLDWWNVRTSSDGHPRHEEVGSSGKIGRGARAHGSIAMSDCVGPGVATRRNDVVIDAMY